jgi:hypothetical protein
MSVASGVDLAKPASEQFMNGPLFRPSNYQIKGTNVAPILESEVSFLTCADDASGQGRSSPVPELASPPTLPGPPPVDDPAVPEVDSIVPKNDDNILPPPVMQPMANEPPSVTKHIDEMPASDAIRCNCGWLSILSVVYCMFLYNT